LIRYHFKSLVIIALASKTMAVVKLSTIILNERTLSVNIGTTIPADRVATAKLVKNSEKTFPLETSSFLTIILI